MAGLSWRKSGLTLVLVAGFIAALGSSPVAARQSSPVDIAADTHEVALAALPREARAAYQLILAGGPFPYAKDGIVFGNRERRLRSRARGYYREYTVRTPGSRDRGAQRIVCGGESPKAPETCYYSDDHYNSFRRIAP